MSALSLRFTRHRNSISALAGALLVSLVSAGPALGDTHAVSQDMLNRGWADANETLKSEFKGVTRTYIPMHAIIRIDEVEKERPGKVFQMTEDGKVVAPFPIYTQNSESSKK